MTGVPRWSESGGKCRFVPDSVGSRTSQTADVGSAHRLIKAARKFTRDLLARTRVSSHVHESQIVRHA